MSNFLDLEGEGFNGFCVGIEQLAEWLQESDHELDDTFKKFNFQNPQQFFSK